MKWAEELKNEYSKIAKENQGMRTDICSTLNECDKIDTKTLVANDLDISVGTLHKAQYIYNNASEEIIKQLDEGQLSINKAYNTLKQQLALKDEELK